MRFFDFGYPVHFSLQKGADGYAYIVEDDRDRNEPILIRCWWPTGLDAHQLAHNYGADLFGLELKRDDHGRFHVKDKPLYVTITTGARAVLTEKLALPAPKQRGAKKPLVYKNGHWLKELKDDYSDAGLIETPVPVGPGPIDAE